MRIWIDLNEDGDYFDADEVVVETIISDNYALLEMPIQYFNATGKHLRISVSRYGYAEVCSDFYSGETEDYLVNYFPEIEDIIIPNGEANDDNSGKFIVDIMPNPTNDLTIIKLSNTTTPTQLKVYDAGGKLVLGELIAAGARSHKTDTSR